MTEHGTVSYLLLDFAVLRHHPVRGGSRRLGQQYTDKHERRSSDGKAPGAFISGMIACDIALVTRHLFTVCPFDPKASRHSPQSASGLLSDPASTHNPNIRPTDFHFPVIKEYIIITIK